MRVTRAPPGNVGSQDDAARQLWESDKPLSERLKVGRGESFDPIPPQLLRKYIAYARKYVHPKLTPDAASILQVRTDGLETYFGLKIYVVQQVYSSELPEEPVLLNVQADTWDWKSMNCTFVISSSYDYNWPWSDSFWGSVVYIDNIQLAI